MKKVVCLFVLTFCGAILAEDANRILDGSPATEGQFNYVVSLQNLQQPDDTRGHSCGGILITLQHVLTAASCVIRDGVFLTINRVFAGAVQLTADNQPDRIRTIANITIHPSYNEATSQNNIAIITLVSPFVSSSTIQSIALPAANSVVPDSTVCEVAGWGGTVSGQNASVHLSFMQKTIANQNLCVAAHNPTFNVAQTMVCASAFRTMSAGCLGDTGSALVCPGRILAGVQIRNNGCQFTAVPEVYTRVSNYTTWIRSVTGGASTFQPSFAILAIFALVQILTIKVIS